MGQPRQRGSNRGTARSYLLTGFVFCWTCGTRLRSHRSKATREAQYPQVCGKAYAPDSKVLGQTVRINGNPGTIVGVMPQGFAFPNNTEVWTTLRLDPVRVERQHRPR